MTSENNSTVAPFSNEMPQSESTLFKSDRLNCIEPPKPPKPPKPPHNTSVGSGFAFIVVLVIVYAIIRYGRMVVKANKQNEQKFENEYD